jgi:hypothetical protein
MEIKARPSNPSAYSVKVTSGAQSQFGLLTYDLLNPDLGRGVVLLRADAMMGELSVDQRNALETLTRLINDTEHLNAEGRMAQAKSLVRRIAAGEISYPGKSILVHRFGPVPALAIDTEQSTKLPDGQEVRLRLGLYIGSSSSASGRLFPEGAPSKVHFLESLKIQTARIFHRYFEDAGEILWAIQHKADLAKALSWGKALETGLAESVKTKLDAVLPDVTAAGSGRKHYHEQASAQSLRTDHGNIVLHTAYARLLILYLINNLYELLGIRSEAQKYFDRLNSFARDLSKWFPPAFIESATENSEALHDLIKVRDGFDASIRAHSASDLPHAGSEIWWIKQVSGFARFLAILRKRGTPEVNGASNLDPRFARVFFSSVHLVPSGIDVFNKMKASLADGRRKALLLSVQERPDAGFRELILARLWLSDAVLAVLPRTPQRLDGSSSAYHWIGKESALALLTDRHVSFALEKGTERERVRPDFEAIDDDLFPWADKKEATDRLIKHFDETVHGEYEVTDPARPLDDRLQDQLEALVQRALVDRTDKLMKGFLDQFPPDVLVNLPILQHARNGQQSPWMVHLLREAGRVKFSQADDERTRKEKAARKFARIYTAANERALVLGNRTYALMSNAWDKRKHHRYKVYFWQLPAILAELRPKNGLTESSEWEAELSEWENELVSWATARGEEALRRRRLAVA